MDIVKWQGASQHDVRLYSTRIRTRTQASSLCTPPKIMGFTLELLLGGHPDQGPLLDLKQITIKVQTVNQNDEARCQSPMEKSTKMRK